MQAIASPAAVAGLALAAHQLAPRAPASACHGVGQAHHPGYQSPAGVGKDSQQQQQQQQHRPCAAAVQGGGDVTRHSPAAAPAAGCPQQPPGTAPCTPEAACEAAAAGELRHRAAGPAGPAPAATTEAASVPAADSLGDDPAGDVLMLRRLQSFVHCVAGSPIVQSALLYLEHLGAHPSTLPASRATAGPAGRAAAAGLEWTLSQLLALWLRAGYTHACESSLLGALWVLESAHSARRSPASLCLSTYTKLVGAFSPEVVRRLTADWPASFAKLRSALVQAQMELLQRTGWRVRLDLAADVLPCHALLFCPAVLGNAQLKLGQPAAFALPPAVDVLQQGAATMRQLCAVIREKSRRLKAHEQATRAARLPTPDCEDEGERPAKRPRAASGP